MVNANKKIELTHRQVASLKGLLAFGISKKQKTVEKSVGSCKQIEKQILQDLIVVYGKLM